MFNRSIIVLILISLFLIGCRSVPIVEITDTAINTSSGKSPSLANVTRGIVQAGNSLGWQMKKQSSGHIIATLYLRKHMAKVDIHYSRTVYSITYKDSTELKYDGTTIHSNYNAWVQRLSNSINTQVFNQN